MNVRKKRLEGIKSNEKLQSLLDHAFHLISTTSKAHCEVGDNTNDETIDLNVVQSALRPMFVESAVLILQTYQSERKKDEKTEAIPIPVIRAMESIFRDDSDSCLKLSSAIRQSGGLFFTPPGPSLKERDNAVDDPNLTNDQRKFRQRMARLRMKHEETKYSRLTNNLGMNPVSDDVTTKSMTYAASIGLNMIIAPLSFGCLMYFFAGGLLDYFWKREYNERTSHHMSHQPDIRKVIAGVVSGVLMLFIEMILFVIRTDAMDRATQRKQKKSRLKPFGHYSSSTTRNFEEKEKNIKIASIKSQ